MGHRISVHRVVSAACAIALLATPALIGRSRAASLVTFDRIRTGGTLRLGYRADARPFAFRGPTGRPAGFSVGLCERIVAAATRELGLDTLPAEWIPLAADTRFQTLHDGRIDIICGAETETLARRELASFSIPIFPGGISVLVRGSNIRLKEVLSGRGPVTHPIWRASATRMLRARPLSIVEGTASEQWLPRRLKELDIVADITRVSTYDLGVQAVMEGRSDAFFGERAILLDAAKRYSYARDLVVLDRMFTHEPLALALPRGDEAFRLLVDRTLSVLYASGEIIPLYANVFGEPDEGALTFFDRTALP